MKKFKVDFNCWSDPEFNLRVVIPSDLKNMWERKEVLYNVNAPGDSLGIDDLFVDNCNLFISTKKAKESHQFMDEDGKLFDENYTDVPESIYQMYNGEFNDEYSFISYDNEYFDSPYREEFECNFNKNYSRDMFRLDWYGISQDEFDSEYQEYYEEYPEDSWSDNDSLNSEEDYYDEDDEWEGEDDSNEYDESFSNSFRKSFKEKISNKLKLSREIKRMLKY